jgi:hypothetical protein
MIRPRPPAKTNSTLELGQQAGEQLKAAFMGRRDIETSAIEWYRGFARGLGGSPLPEVEAFIVDQCQRIGDEKPRKQSRAELAILDVLARSPLDLLPRFDDPPIRRRRATRGNQATR